MLVILEKLFVSGQPICGDSTYLVIGSKANYYESPTTMAFDINDGSLEWKFQLPLTNKISTTQVFKTKWIGKRPDIDYDNLNIINKDTSNFAYLLQTSTGQLINKYIFKSNTRSFPQINDGSVLFYYYSMHEEGLRAFELNSKTLNWNVKLRSNLKKYTLNGNFWESITTTYYSKRSFRSAKQIIKNIFVAPYYNDFTPLIFGEDIIACSSDGILASLKKSNGKFSWTFSTNKKVNSSPKYIDDETFGIVSDTITDFYSLTWRNSPAKDN